MKKDFDKSYEAPLPFTLSGDQPNLPSNLNVQSVRKSAYPPNSTLAKLRSTEGLGPSTLSIIEEAERRGIPWRRMDENCKVLLGYGTNQQLIRATITAKTSCLGVETVDDKYATKNILAAAGIPVAEGFICNTVEELQDAVIRFGWPLVTKPLNANHGKGVAVDLRDLDIAKEAFAYAQTYSSDVLVEKYIEGEDHRILVINGKFVAASHRKPAHIIGDGKSTVQQLIEEINQQPERGRGHEAALTRITVDCDTNKQLQKKNYDLDSVPTAGETVVLKSTANLSTGGTAVDITDHVHSANRFMAERIAALLGLDICGIDLIAPDIKSPIAENGGAVIEVNAAPGFRMHLAPSEGKPRNVASAVVDMLYPPESESRIPIFAITGTNGKTTTTRLLAHIVQSCGYFPGYTTTDGIYISGHQVITGDCSGPSSASTILADPMVDFAVFETARGGLLRSGLAFDFCDAAVMTNIAADHLGLKNINTLEELAEVKAAVVRSVKQTGWAVFNAEDQNCVNVSKTVDCEVGYFSLDSQNELIAQHIANGGLAAIVEEGQVVIHHQNQRTVIAGVEEIPLTLNGTSKCMTANILASAAVAFSYGFTAEQIRAALMSFIPGPEFTPGRMNYFKVRDFSVLVDYAHNPHGLREMQDYLTHIEANRKVGIIAGVGDRRDSDIVELAEIAGSMFDHIIVRQERSLRGRELSEMHHLMVNGIERAGRNISYELIPDEKEAIRHALETAQSGDYIVALSDNYTDVIRIIHDHQH